MICKGTRPDGTPCPATDEYVSAETGLCWSCAEPETKALVPLEDAPLVIAEPVPLTFDENLPWKCVAWLRAFIATRYIGKAAATVGVDRGAHHYWKKTVPGFDEAFEIALQDVRDQEFDLLGQDNEPGGGLKEVMYDGEGEIKYTRYRQSEGLRKMRLLALDPERYAPEKSQDSGVTIILRSVHEGGWGDEADQQPQEILRNEDGRVSYPDGKGGWSSEPTAQAIEPGDVAEAEVVETETGSDQAPGVTEQANVISEEPVEEHTVSGGGSWRQRQFYPDWLSELPGDE